MLQLVITVELVAIISKLQKGAKHPHCNFDFMNKIEVRSDTVFYQLGRLNNTWHFKFCLSSCLFSYLFIYLSCACVCVNFIREKRNRIKVKCSFDSFIIIIIIIIIIIMIIIIMIVIIIIHCCCRTIITVFIN